MPEGNYGLLWMLANTRAAEKAFKQGKGSDPATQDNATGGGDQRRLPERVHAGVLPDVLVRGQHGQPVRVCKRHDHPVEWIPVEER